MSSSHHAPSGPADLLVSTDTGISELQFPALCPTRHGWGPPRKDVPFRLLKRVFCDRNVCVFCGPRKARVLADAIAAAPITHELTLTHPSPPNLTDDHARTLRRMAGRMIRYTRRANGFYVIERGEQNGRLHCHLAVRTTPEDLRRMQEMADEQGIVIGGDAHVIRNPAGFSKYMLKEFKKERQLLWETVGDVRPLLDDHLRLNARRFVWATAPKGQRPWLRAGVPLTGQNQAIAKVRRSWREMRPQGR